MNTLDLKAQVCGFVAVLKCSILMLCRLLAYVQLDMSLKVVVSVL